MQLSDSYVNLCTSYELNAIYNVTRNTAVNTVHIIGIYSWKNMPARLHMYVPLY